MVGSSDEQISMEAEALYWMFSHAQIDEVEAHDHKHGYYLAMFSALRKSTRKLLRQ